MLASPRLGWDAARVLPDPHALSFAPPRLDRAIDLETILARAPRGATTKGVAIKAALDRVHARPDLAEWTDERVLAEAGVPAHRPGLLQDTPWSNYVRVCVFVAGLLRGSDRLAEGLRDVGVDMYKAFGETLVGRMLFGTLGRNFARVLMMGPNAWRVCTSFGEVRAEQQPGQHVRYTFTDYPVEMVETAFVGMIEGACAWHGIEAELLVAEADSRTMVIDIVWRYIGS